MRFIGVLTAVCVGVVWGGMGCTPTFNWREVQVAGSAIRATLPCKPDHAQRDVVLDSHVAQLSMLSCDAGGVTFSVSSLRVPPSMQPDEVRVAWQRANAVSLRVPEGGGKSWSPALRGFFDAGVDVKGWVADGIKPNGAPVQAHVVALVARDEVAQVAAYGPMSAQIMSSWLEGVAWQGNQ